MRRFAACLMACVLCPAASSWGGTAPAFTKKPTAARDGDRVKIEFGVNVETDVAVYVEDAEGRIVRHLTAGVLGKNPPAPLKANALEQTVYWDGKDDIGRPAAVEGVGAFKVRVALGLRPVYAGTAMSQQTGPNNISGVWGLAAGGGRAYVLASRWGKLYWHATSLHVFRRDGSYEKTIKPFGANLTPEQVAGTGAFRGSDGRLLPVIHHPLDMTFYPFVDIPHQPALTAKGQLMLAVVPPQFESSSNQKISAHVATIDSDGALPYATYAGPALGKVFAPDKPKCLAVSSDGGYIYITGIGVGVTRAKLPDRGPAEEFSAEVAAPASLACDGNGHLLVSDPAKNRVVVLDEKDKSVAGTIAVTDPAWVGVDSRTGAVYVNDKDGVVKFSGWKDAKEAARLAFPVPKDYRGRPTHYSFALDASADPPVLWIGSGSDKNVLRRCEDRGDKFTEPAPVATYPSPFLWNISVDPTRKQVSCRTEGGWARTLRVLDEPTGALRDVRVPAGSTQCSGFIYRLGPGGERIYVMDVVGPIRQMDKNGKTVPFPATAENPDKAVRGSLGNMWTGDSGWTRDFSVDRRGNLHVQNRPAIAGASMRVFRHNIYSADGTLQRMGILSLSTNSYGPRVDNAGNIYLAEIVKRPGETYPDEFKGKLPPPGAGVDRPEGWYRWMYGSLIKFGPEGGAIWLPCKGDEYAFGEDMAKLDPLAREEMSNIFGNMRFKKPVILQGAKWRYPGFSHFAPKDATGDDHCHCEGQEFDVDDFGRSFLPDTCRYRVAVLDTNGNEILTFGGYGNQDFCGPDSYVADPKEKFLRPRRPDDPPGLKSPFAEPEIAIGWICGLGVSDRYAYVADAINRRVLRVGLEYAATETAAVR